MRERPIQWALSQPTTLAARVGVFDDRAGPLIVRIFEAAPQDQATIRNVNAAGVVELEVHLDRGREIATFAPKNLNDAIGWLETQRRSMKSKGWVDVPLNLDSLSQEEFERER